MKAVLGTAVILTLLMTLLPGQAAYGQVSFGIQIGRPPAPPVYVGVRPVAPGPGYIWVDGYWTPYGRNYNWFPGYWTAPPYVGARWVTPRYDHDRYYYGYWEGNHGRRYHDYQVDTYYGRNLYKYQDHDRYKGDDHYKHDYKHDGKHRNH